MIRESVIQNDCVKWFNQDAYLRNQRGLLRSNHNNADDEVKGAIAVGLGRVAGAADLEYNMPGGKTVFIEMKTPTGTQQPSQVKWQALVEANGYEYYIIRSLEEFKTLIYNLNGWL